LRTGCPEMFDHPVQVVHDVVDHEGRVRCAEVIRVLWKQGPYRYPFFVWIARLSPGKSLVIAQAKAQGFQGVKSCQYGRNQRFWWGTNHPLLSPDQKKPNKPAKMTPWKPWPIRLGGRGVSPDGATSYTCSCDFCC